MKKILLIAILFVAFGGIPSADAATYDYRLLEPLLGGEDSDSGDFPTYIGNVYKFAIWTVGIAALFMLSIGGFMYMTSAGNNANAEAAKRVIKDALLGLIVALLGWVILNTINPDLVNGNLSSITNLRAPSPGDGSDGGTGSGTGGNDNTGGTGQVVCGDCVSLTEKDIPTKPAPDGCKDPGPCKASTTTTEKLSNLNTALSNENIEWRVTEAWPPTVTHENGCHNAGTCVDANFTSGTQVNSTNINTFITAAESSGLKPVYEVSSQSEYDVLIQGGVDKKYLDVQTHITAPHFSLYS